MGYYLEKNKEKYVILEKNEISGSFFTKYPIKRRLISSNKRYVESDPETDINEFAYRHDWNSLICDNPELKMKNYSKDYFPTADVYVKYLNDFSSYYNLNIKYSHNVTNISKNTETNLFEINVNNNIMICKYLIICTGLSQQYVPSIKGIEHSIGYDELSEDVSQFEDKQVCILGKGNAALETAESIIHNSRYICLISRNPPSFSWNTHFVGDIRAVNNNFFDTYQLKSMSFSYEKSDIEIKKIKNKYTVSGTDYLFDKVIRCTGFRYNSSFLDKEIRPEITKDKFPKINWKFESVKTENLFFGGAVTQSLDYKEGTLAFVHGFRYSANFIYEIIRKKDKNLDFQHTTITKDIKQLTQIICKELSTNSCIWQGFKYWCIAIVIENDVFKIYKNIPVNFIKNYNIYWYIFIINNARIWV